MDHCKMINNEHSSMSCVAVSSVPIATRESSLGNLWLNHSRHPSSKLADIMVNHFAIQHAPEQVSHSTKPVDTICHNRHQAAHTSHNSNGHTPSATSKDCPNCTQQHPASRTNCPTCDSHCSKCHKTGH